MNRILTLLLAFGLMSGPTFGQAANDAAPTSAEYTFRFVADKDMFYVPWSGNGEELERLLTCIAQHKGAILEGVIPVEVYGYCNSQATAAENLAMAKIRSNRVKSEMILRGGLTESCFTTKNHTSGGNQVIVRIVLPAEKPAGQPTPAAPVPETPATPAETTPADSADAVPPVLEAPAEETPVDAGEKSCLSNLSLRANLLRWATLTPDVGLEWRIGNRWSIGVNGSWTSWSWNDKERRYALWEVAPEVRCYLGEKRAWYLGAMFKAGQFNYKLSGTGRQGDLLGGGLSGGYLLSIGRSLSLDFSLGLGYLDVDYEKYIVVDGVRVRQGSGTKNWWGPINAGISLVWHLGN